MSADNLPTGPELKRQIEDVTHLANAIGRAQFRTAVIRMFQNCGMEGCVRAVEGMRVESFLTPEELSR